MTEDGPGGGLTVRYLAGPKQGQHIHFFSPTELDTLFTGQFAPVLPLRLRCTQRMQPQPGQWSQWEALWRKRADHTSTGD